jgi:hypothetical protein
MVILSDVSLCWASTGRTDASSASHKKMRITDVQFKRF